MFIYCFFYLNVHYLNAFQFKSGKRMSFLSANTRSPRKTDAMQVYVKKNQPVSTKEMTIQTIIITRKNMSSNNLPLLMLVSQ